MPHGMLVCHFVLLKTAHGMLVPCFRSHEMAHDVSQAAFAGKFLPGTVMTGAQKGLFVKDANGGGEIFSTQDAWVMACATSLFFACFRVFRGLIALVPARSSSRGVKIVLQVAGVWHRSG